MKAPAFQFYPDDFVGGVADMTQAEVGAYILLLCSQWGRGEIPLDPERAALIAKGPVPAHVMRKFPNGKNPRLEIVRAKLDEFRAMQSAKGQASAKARFNRGSTVVQPKHQPNGNSPDSDLRSPSPTANSNSPDLASGKPPRERNLSLDALALLETPDVLQVTNWPKHAKALKLIRSVSPDVTPNEIARRGANYLTHMPKALLTSTALANHWGKCDMRNINGHDPAGYAQDELSRERERLF